MHAHLPRITSQFKNGSPVKVAERRLRQAGPKVICQPAPWASRANNLLKPHAMSGKKLLIMPSVVWGATAHYARPTYPQPRTSLGEMRRCGLTLRCSKCIICIAGTKPEKEALATFCCKAIRSDALHCVACKIPKYLSSCMGGVSSLLSRFSAVRIVQKPPLSNVSTIATWALSKVRQD